VEVFLFKHYFTFGFSCIKYGPERTVQQGFTHILSYFCGLVMKKLISICLLLAGTISAQAQLSGSSYTQNFNSIGGGLPQGWYVDSGATNNQLGTSLTLWSGNAPMKWGHTSGWFKNFASANSLTMGADSATQAQSPDRALGIRQTGAFGDPNAAICFKIDNTNGKINFNLNFKLQSLDTGSTRTTSWKVDYGVGNNPTSFTNLNTTGTMVTGSQQFTNNTINVTIGSLFDNINQPLWIRVRPAAGSSGSGTRASTAIDDFNLSWTNTTVSSPSIDTIRVMNYNLLFYGDTGNDTAYKNTRLATIIQHEDPDIFGANEILNNNAYQLSILNTALGSAWSKGNYTNTSSSQFTNMLYWKTAKFGLVSQSVVANVERDILAFKLYYKDNVTNPDDTVFLTVLVAHLKAGSTSADSITRAQETQLVANYLNNSGPGNFIFMGDLNVYTSNEQCYKNVVDNTNPNGKLYDPINSPGNWSGNPAFASLHTQSTRTASLSDGGSNGGMDDRLDQQLVSNPIMQGTHGMEYIAQSYWAVGQDGQHFNDALTDMPTNTSVPANVLNALYELSDHLPVRADYRIFIPNLSVKETAKKLYDIKVANPIDNKLTIWMDSKLNGKKLELKLVSVDGKVVYSNSVTAAPFMQLPLSELSNGMYFLYMNNAEGHIHTSKLIKY
jgi:endonuclease/exonuclease/phosphatase family metal-dependent hydrolase